MSRFEQRKQEALRDPEIREAYDAAELELRFRKAAYVVCSAPPPTGIVGMKQVGYDYFTQAIYTSPDYQIGEAVAVAA